MIKHSNEYKYCYFLLAVIIGLVLNNKIIAQGNEFVKTKGENIIYEGKPILLKGINLGNWLVPEGYMFKFKTTNSYRLINDLIDELVGPEDASKFWKTYRERYITEKDIQFIKKCGLNSVRIPFNYKLFVSEEHPGVWYDEGFQLLDSVINWCRENKVWVIFDMHCAPGGQTGDNIDDGWGYPFLFTSKESQDLTALLWQKIASRYKDEKIIVGYDLLNEPIAPFLIPKSSINFWSLSIKRSSQLSEK